MAENIILFIIFILFSSFLYPKGIDVCLSGGAVLQNTNDYLQINNSGVLAGGFIIGSLQLSYKDLTKGVYPFTSLAYSFPGESELGELSILYETLLLSGGFGKHFKIENSSFDILLSVGNRWQKYDITYFPDEVSFSLNTILLSIGGRIRSPLYKRIYTTIGYDYLRGKNQRLSATGKLNTTFELKTYGSLHLWTVGLGLEF